VSTITTVDPSTRRIEAKLKDGGEVQVSLFDVPPFFVWPKTNERWIIRKDGGYWKLDTRLDTDLDHPVDNLNPGEAKIGADIIKTPTGKQVVTVSSNESPVIYSNNSVSIGSIKIIVGTGSPEGVVEASIGSLFTRTDGSSGSTLYVKTSGTESTGWDAVG
jgi:hypothetical protein